MTLKPLLVVKLPGKPMAEGRPRTRVIQERGRKAYATIYPDPTSKNWRMWARSEMQRAVELAGYDFPYIPDGPVSMIIIAVWPLSKSLHRKTKPVSQKRKNNGPDWDNVGKAVSDAGNGVLYTDDRQIALGTVKKLTAAQGEAPCVIVSVLELSEDVP